jgi:polycystin 2
MHKKMLIFQTENSNEKYLKYSLDRFYGLTERMGRMEATLGPIMSKIDSVLERLDDMKKAKKKKRDTIQRLMETIEDNEGCK